MLKLLVIICCEVIMNSRGKTSYSYEAGYVDESKNYTITIYTTKKYEIGDTVCFFEGTPKIDWSDTSEFYRN